MSLFTTIQNPLAVDLQHQIYILVAQLPQDLPHISAIQKATSGREALTILSQLIIVPSLTEVIALTFRPLLLDICARVLERNDQIHQKFEALCLLLQPHEELYPILSELIRQHIPRTGPLTFVLESDTPETIDASTLHRSLLAYYRVLQANRELPHHFHWPLSPFSKLFWGPHPDPGARYLAIRCYALQSGMGEAERNKLENEILGLETDVDCLIQYGEDIQGTSKSIDGWILPIVESRRIWERRNSAASAPLDYFTADGSVQIADSDLCSFTVNNHGILLFRPSSPEIRISELIPTSTSIAALRALAVHHSLRLPIILTSAPSAGKSLLLSHLAGLLHPGAKNQIITIALADTSLDPRSLLGSYASSPTSPGAFEWKEGVVVRAMREGRWIVFEDIDRSSNEVLGTIKPLIQSMGLDKWIGGRARLTIPTRGTIIAAESFAVFATRSLIPPRSGVFPKATFFGSHKFHEVVVPSPSSEELRLILEFKFPKLAGSAILGIIKLWEAIKSLGAAPSSRQIGLRELEKFCSRADALLPTSYQPIDIDLSSDETFMLSVAFSNPTLREEIYFEARDVFFGSATLTAAATAHAEAVAAVAAEHMGLSPQQREWVLTGRVPEFELEKDVNGRTTALRVGRIRLPARSSRSEIAPLSSARPFAMHRPAILLMSRIATALSLSEPILLTGETGTGKTSLVTHMAGLLHRPLISLNLSQQSESSDLLGGFKPVDTRVPSSELQAQFLELFRGTFSQKKNAKFEESVRRAVQEGKWKRAVGLWRESVRLAKERIEAKLAEPSESDGRKEELDSDAPRKRRKTDHLRVSLDSWLSFEHAISNFEVQHVKGKSKLAFSFVEGPLVKALRSGDWVLLDEINLAGPETLEAVSNLLHSPTASITLTEQGSLEPVPRHPDFRLFACMNPATDVGKKDLPPNVRSRFTEIDVPPPDADKETLLSIVHHYIGASAVGDKAAIMDITEFYTAVKHLAGIRQIADGANHRPHFSMRTLARALTFAAEIAGAYSLRRALWEGFLMAFTMVLDGPSAELVTALAQKRILAGVRNPRSLLAREPSAPTFGSPDDFIKLGPFYLEKGPVPSEPMDDYVLTPSVEKKLIDLARIILTRRFPVLIEGPTSAGKTSSIEYLAKRTGHRFVRINNHEHTDIQEYLGTYVSDPITGKLVFKDGLLVQALRNGDWIVLDELNLAPTDVLEALNRLLDDNRELVIPETQEVVRPHPHFVLFATQNPPGLYAGRKVLSRAFRNRFLEVHFEDVPQAELETILCQRCRIAPSYGQRIVEVFRELQKRRQASRVFESKHGFATLRDLFRWAGRDAVGYQELAENGYMLLAERARRDDDKSVVKEVIESVMKVKIDESSLYDFHRTGVDVQSLLGFTVPQTFDIVWTQAMQRVLVLVGRALRFNEPVLLVGETGTGKTSVCQIYADAVKRRLIAVSCHQNTETADLIGGLRPIRDRAATVSEACQEATTLLAEHGITDTGSEPEALLSLLGKLVSANPALSSRVLEVQQRLHRASALFDWRDGPLVEAMQSGEVFLLDEISLADDSVLERLNSVLEPARTVVLAERGGNSSEDSVVRAGPGFQLVATMNPGGDFGKKELSPALRNRFTEIWVPAIDNLSDIEQIIESSWRHESLKAYTGRLLEFYQWIHSRVQDRHLLGLRDILAWVGFSNSTVSSEAMKGMHFNEIFHHGAYMTCLDGLGSLPQLSSYSSEALQSLRNDAVNKLQELAPLPIDDGATMVPMHDPSRFVQLGVFAVPRGPQAHIMDTYNLDAPTTRENAVRVIRACQTAKPILLEGSPGVGKTSLIKALANICGYHLCRINLSDQTELADLFGSDLPVEGGGPNEFAWKDAEFLTALQQGHWVLLDEMNLAPQAVLEGLNALLDHRGTVYIPELGRSFPRHPSFRVFAAQNPIQQGGGRKGLPKSFVNRFSRVYVQALDSADLLQISRHAFPEYPVDWLQRMIDYTSRLEWETVTRKSFGRTGSPWEFNLRDVSRWIGLLQASAKPLHPVEHLYNVYLARFRVAQDRQFAQGLFDQAFNMQNTGLALPPRPSLSPSHLQVGHYIDSRRNYSSASRSGRLLQAHLRAAEAIGVAVQHGSLVILTGYHDSGKTSLVRTMADLTGNVLHEVSINGGTDTLDLLGTFEQIDASGRWIELAQRAAALVGPISRSIQGSKLGELVDLSFLEVPTLNYAHLPSVFETMELVLRRLDGLTILDTEQVRERDYLVSQIQQQLAQSQPEGRFEWVDGPLVRALKEGHWLLLDDANLCSPSVLDRLNSLCEPLGSLILNERGHVDGNVPVVTPHPDFRLFMSIDPQYGELSRAMRNRGIEISLDNHWTVQDVDRIQDHVRLPCTLAEQPLANNAVYFELSRRGLAYPQETCVRGVEPSGYAIAQDSPSSAIANLLPLLRIPLPEPVRDAGLHFAVASIAPKYLHRLCCFLSDFRVSTTSPDLSPLNMVLETSKKSISFHHVDQIRHQLGQGSPMSADILPFQPMGFFIMTMNIAKLSSEIRCPSMPSTFLRILELFVRLTIDRCLEHMLVNPLSSIMNRMKDDDSPILRQAIKMSDDVVASIHQVGSDTIERHTRELHENGWGEISLALRLHKLAQFLYNSCIHGFNISIVQVVTGWMLEGLRNVPDSLPFVREKVEALQRLVTPTSGLGLGEIWAGYRSSSPAPSPSSLQLEALAINSASERGIHKLRAHVLDLLALEALPNASNDSGHTLEVTIEDIKNRLTKSSHESIVQSSHLKDDRILLIRELGVLARLCVGQDNATDISGLLNAACQDPEGPLVRFIPYRHAVWEIKTGKLTTMAMAALQTSWLRALWNVDASRGPIILIEPTQFILTMAKCDWTNVTLRSSKRYQSDLHRHAKLILMASGSQISRIEELVSFCYRNLLTLSSCFLDFEETTRVKLQQATQDFRRLYSFSDLVNILQQSSHPQFRSSSVRLLEASSTLFDSSVSASESVLAIGHFLVSFSQFFVELYVPNTPVDPLAKQQCVAEFWDVEQAHIAEELRLHSELEVRETGETRNGMTEYLRQRLVDAHGHLDGIPPISKVCRRDPSRLTAFWSEVSQFLSTVMEGSKLNVLLSLIKSGDPVASMREHVVQESISGFCQRLDTAYPEFRDLFSPFQWALLQMKLGLRLLAHVSMTADKGLDTFAKDLVIFPSVRSAQVLGSSPEASSVLGSHEAFKVALLKLASLSLEVDIGLELSSRAEKIHALYEQAVRLWSIDRTKQSEADQAAASLYKGGATSNEAVPDSVLEEREFLEMFPSFDDITEGVDDITEGVDELKAENDMLGTKTLVDAIFAQQLVDLHLRILAPQDRPGHPSPDAYKGFSNIRVTIEKAILEQGASQLSESLDKLSSAHQFALLKERLSSLETHSGSRTCPYNFYLDPNVPEVQKASKLIEIMEDRLQTLIQEWPDQMVLQHLRDRCGQIMTTSLHSPVAKVLSMLELLLLQTEDWEMFANRDNSLKDHRQALIVQIVEWRRLELSSWQGLLETQLIAFEHGAFDWWFRLYDLVIRGPLGVVELEKDIGGTEEYMEKLVPLVDEFIKSSSMGQFCRRMDLLRSFEILLGHLSASMATQERSVLERVLRILINTRNYYLQYASRVSQSFATQRNALEKEIKGFIKLASWKDINVHALKASATRTHHQLYKCIRKFREIMRQPIDGLFQLEMAGNAEGTHSFNSLPLRGQDNAAASEFPARSQSANAPHHLQQLPQTYKKYQTLLHARIGSFIRSRPFQHMDSLAVEIIEVSQSLSSIAIPSDIPKEKQQKQAKAILVRKRKAWSDLLKELKRVGFAAHVRPEILQQQQNERWLREQAVISSSKVDTSDSEKMERYWLRLRGLLPGVRATLADHHSDIGTRELQRGVMLLESGLSIALSSRSRLASLTSSYERFINITRRLCMLQQTSEVASSGDESLRRVLRLKDFLCRCYHALFEAGQQLEAFGTLPSAPPIPPILSEELSVLMASTQTHRDRLFETVNNMRLTGTPLLLEDECKGVQDSHAHVLHVLTQHRSWEEEHGYLRDILSPIREWVESQTALLPLPEATQITSGVVDADHVIEAFLKTVQSILAKIPAEVDLAESPDQDKYVKDTSRVMEQLSSALRVDTILDTLECAVAQLATASPDNIQLNVSRFLPFVEHYGALVEEHVQVLTKWTGSLFKLEYVLCSIIHTIAKQGFCKPPDVEEAGQGDEGVETSGGTGLGEGTGTENVSNEIEDESQVEGLKDEDQGTQGERNKDEDNQDKDNTIEMGQDFEGELEDVPEGEEAEDENDDDAEEAEEPEGQIGDVGENDEGKVDEKLWGDEKGTEENEGKTNEDHSTSKGDESEVVAKEGGKKDNDKKPKEDKAGEESKEENIDESMPEDGADEDAGALPEPNEAGAPIDDYVQDAETLDLPEDLDMGAEGEQDDALGQDDEMDLGDDGPDEEQEQEGEEETEHRPASSDAADDEGVEDDSQNEKFAQATEDDANLEGETPEEEIAQPDLQQGDRSAADTVREVSQNTFERDTADTGEGGGTQGAAGNDTGAGQQANQEAESKPADGEQQSAAPEETSTGTGGATTGGEPGNAPSQDIPQTGLSSNPLRSLGDALREIRQRFDDILESAGQTGDQPMPQAADFAEPAQLEYLHPDDVDQNMQALGPAGSEEVAKLSELKLVDEEVFAEPDVPMDMDDPTLPEQLANPPPISSLQSDPTTEALQEDVESALTQHQMRSQQPGQAQPDPSLDLHAPKADVDMEEPEGQEIVEAELRRWQAEGQPKQGAEHLWRQYESLTHDLSFALCEQLRLILEPTLATRLKGDYRTGKRLNMKKIIPYIASEYTKDKIWLRRTRPSQREYQVLIALDDSRSMAESHSVHLAYETLALVSKALSRLEVGDIGIAKFGENVDVLHSFDEGAFTDQAGMQVMSAFRFHQKATNVLSMVEASLQILESARDRRSAGSSCAADLWQLEIIISDGICQEHDKLRTVLRKAEEQRVMVVFIVIDSLHSNTTAATGSKATGEGKHNNSILSMNQVAYKNVDGKMELQMQRYLDSFPFEYYVVLRSVEALPEVLSSTLKQFFERISED